MERPCIFLLVSLCVCLGVYEVSAETPYIELFLGPNQTDYSIRLNSSLQALDRDLNDKVQSFKLHGTVILYDYYGYNGGSASSRHVALSSIGDNANLEGTDASLSTVSSVRFFGSYVNGSHVPSLTLFSQPYFSGVWEEIVTESKGVLNTTNVLSVALVGVNDWTFYDEINFGGAGLCLKGTSDYTGVNYFPDTRKEEFFLPLKRSVEVGCWERHGVPLKQ